MNLKKLLRRPSFKFISLPLKIINGSDNSIGALAIAENRI